MPIDFEKDSLCINQIVGQKIENITISGDVIVPDIKPDILNTIHTSGNVFIYKKEALEGKIKIEGSTNIYIMYLADGEVSTVRSLNTCIDFSEMIDFENIKSDMNLEIEPTIKQIDCKVLNGRKVNIKVMVELKQRVYSNETKNYIKSVSNKEDIQVLNKSFGINSLIGVGTNKIYAKDTLMIENIDNLAEILKVDMKIINKDIKISYNKVLAKADINMKIMYLTEDDRINCIESKIPAIGFVDIQDVNDDNIIDTNYELKNLVIKPNTTEEHSIYVEAEIELSCKAYQNKQIDIIQDLYSPTRDFRFKQNQIKTLIDKQENKEICNIRQSMKIPEIVGNKIYDVEVIPTILKQDVLNEQVVYEGEVALKFIYSSSNSVSIDTKTVTIPYNFNMNIPKITKSTAIQTSLEVNAQNFIIMPDDNVDINVDLNFIVNTSKNIVINIIDDVEEIENREQNPYSIIIYFVKPGDSLWQIAKRFKSTIDDIVKVNKIEDPNKIMPGEQLFIPRYVQNRITA